MIGPNSKVQCRRIVNQQGICIQLKCYFFVLKLQSKILLALFFFIVKENVRSRPKSLSQSAEKLSPPECLCHKH